MWMELGHVAVAGSAVGPWLVVYKRGLGGYGSCLIPGWMRLPSEHWSLVLELGQGSTSVSAVGYTDGRLVTRGMDGSCWVAGQTGVILDHISVCLELS